MASFSSLMAFSSSTSRRLLTYTKTPPVSISSRISSGFSFSISDSCATRFSLSSGFTLLGLMTRDFAMRLIASSLPFLSRILPRGDCLALFSSAMVIARSASSSPSTSCSQANLTSKSPKHIQITSSSQLILS